MDLKKYLILFPALFLSFTMAFSQVTVTGKVTDDIGEGLVGVNVQLKGSSVGTITDIDGNYSLELPDNAGTLVFSFIGFKTQEIPIGNQSRIDISMELDIAQLDEVVVVGYGSQRKKDITGAVSILDTEELQVSQFTNITDRLQGRAPGVQVTNSGEPGSVGSIRIRGTGFFGGNEPLFVIDGVLTGDSPNLNPNDVESIQILKDASSTAIYGSRAANGVVVITTKKGRRGEPVINVSANVGLQQIPNRLDMMNAEEYARVANAAYDNEGLERLRYADDLSHGYDTDWQDAVFRNGMLQDFNVSISGGGDNNNVYFSLNNTYQEAVVQGPLFDRVSARLNTEFELFDGLSIGENLTVSRARSSGQQTYFIGESVIESTLGMLPIIPVEDPTRISGYGYGDITNALTFIPNPVGVRDLYKNKSSDLRILGNFFLNYEPIEGLKYRFSLGLDANYSQFKDWNKAGEIRLQTPHQSGLSEGRSESQEVFIENRLTYSKAFGDHSFTVMGTYTEQAINGAGQSTFITGGYAQEDPFFQISATTAPANNISTSGDEFTSVIRSYLGRLTYNYQDRYLLTGNIRYDGSSKFSEDNRWGLFPSVSAGWNITNESFFNVPQISNLKLRAGYGEVGNASIGDYLYQALIFSTSIGGVNYNFGPESTSVIGATRSDVVNPNIQWEVLKETNIGVDLVMFDGKLEFIGDYYFGDLEDLLTEVPIPLTVAPGGGAPTVNATSMKRSGWEAALTYRKLEGDFQYSISANAFNTYVEVRSLPFGVPEFIGENSISRIGTTLGEFYVLEYDGIYESQQEIDGHGVTILSQTPQVGDARYKDIDGDGNINLESDRVLAGSPLPDFQFGLNLEGSYKNFDLTLFFQGVFGRDAYNTQYADLNNSTIANYTADYDPFIEGSGSDPRPLVSVEGGNTLPSTRFIQDASFVRLKNLQLGYTIPWNRVKYMRIFIGGQNLLTFTGFKGLDPEFEGGIFSPGIYSGGFPNIRTFNTGINVTF